MVKIMDRLKSVTVALRSKVLNNLNLMKEIFVQIKYP
jgi:hypothetical protein